MKPIVSFFQVFGRVYHIFVFDHLYNRINKKVIRYIFIGYDNNKKGENIVTLQL